MYKDPGNIIKKIADALFGVSLVGVLILSIILGRDYYGDFSFIKFLLYLAIGSGISYISFLALAAFGEVVQNTTSMVKQQENMLQEMKKITYEMSMIQNSMQHTQARKEVKEQQQEKTVLKKETVAENKKVVKEQTLPKPEKVGDKEEFKQILVNIVNNPDKLKKAEQVIECLESVEYNSKVYKALMDDMKKYIMLEEMYGSMEDSIIKSVNKYLDELSQ